MSKNQNKPNKTVPTLQEEVEVKIKNSKYIGMIIGKKFTNIKKYCVLAGKKYNTKTSVKCEDNCFKLKGDNLEALQMVKNLILEKEKEIVSSFERKELIITLENPKNIGFIVGKRWENINNLKTELFEDLIKDKIESKFVNSKNFVFINYDNKTASFIIKSKYENVLDCVEEYIVLKEKELNEKRIIYLKQKEEFNKTEPDIIIKIAESDSIGFLVGSRFKNIKYITEKVQEKFNEKIKINLNKDNLEFEIRFVEKVESRNKKTLEKFLNKFFEKKLENYESTKYVSMDSWKKKNKAMKEKLDKKYKLNNSFTEIKI